MSVPVPPPSARRSAGRWGFRVGGAVLAAVLVLVLALPLLALFVTADPAELAAGLAHPVAGPALLLSLLTTFASLLLVVVLGTPLAWFLARARGPIARVVETLVALPVVVPPAVAGLALLLTFGRRGLFGPALGSVGAAISFTSAAVVLAQLFVAAPFYVQGAAAAFRSVDANLLVVARSLGASPARAFFRIALPLARPGLLAGAALAWARALGEFGATLMFAGNLPGKTQTLPLAIYTALESDLRAAQALSLVLVIVAFGLLLFLRAQGLPGAAIRSPAPGAER
jgi:molybdate transport system permease protein